VDHRDQEIEQLNEELDGKVRDHDKEILQVEADWRDEFLEARTQVDELKDVRDLTVPREWLTSVQVLEGREQDIKEIREVLTEREEELAAATNRVAVLEAAQGETHDQLEETMRNIDRDNADKEADLVAANREVEEVRSCERLMLTYRQLGQRVLELEEGIETFRIRERDLNADLRSADEAFENAKTHYENLVNALKEARRKLQDERDGALVDAKLAQEKRVVDKDAWRKENLDEAEKHRRILADKDQVCRSHVGGTRIILFR